MTFQGALAWIAAAWWTAAFGFLCLSVLAAFVHPIVQRRRARNRYLPPLSFVLPVKALDAGFRRAQESLLTQSYPEAELLVSAAEEDSPALAAIRDILARAARFPARILRSTGHFAASPKLNNLIEAFRQARYDTIATLQSRWVFGVTNR